MIEDKPQWKWPDGWTPAHHWYMRAEEIGYTRQRQQAWLVLWKQRQQRTHEWVCFPDVADWCARASGSIARDEGLRAQAWHDLLVSAIGGEFTRNGRLSVAYIAPWQFVCPEPIRFRLPLGFLDTHYLPHCWAPRELW